MCKRYFILIFLTFITLTSCNRPKRHLVISKIKSTAKLATTETIIDKVVIGYKNRKFVGLINLGNAEYVAYTEATVKTGVDLTKLDKDDIKINGSQIEIELPMVEVIDFSYPFEKFRPDTLLSDNDLFNRIDVVDQEEFFRQAEIDIREHLEYMGIKEQTEINTRKLMESMLTNMGYKEIYISFSDSGKFISQINPNPTIE